MKITVINGTEKHGVTYRLKEMFLVALRGYYRIFSPQGLSEFLHRLHKLYLKG